MDNQELEQDHPIFADIKRRGLAAVQQRVRADAAVLEERESEEQRTPLMRAIQLNKPAIALWLIQHRGQHDLDTADDNGRAALHLACSNGPLSVVEALVAAGANPAALDGQGDTALVSASCNGHIDIVAFLLQLPAVKATIDHIGHRPWTALSYASRDGHESVVQLLLDAGADPTIPAGDDSPLSKALSNNHEAVAELLGHAFAEADRVRTLHKVRCLLGAGAGGLACLRGRVEQGQTMPQLKLTPQQQHQQFLQQQHQQQEQRFQQQLQKLQQDHLAGPDVIQMFMEQQQQIRQLQRELQQQGDDDGGREKLRATAAFAVGVSGGEKDTGLCEDLYLKLLGYMLPAWANKGPLNRRRRR